MTINVFRAPVHYRSSEKLDIIQTEYPEHTANVEGFVETTFRARETACTMAVLISLSSLRTFTSQFRPDYTNQIKSLEAEAVNMRAALNERHAEVARKDMDITQLEQAAARRLDEIQGLKNQLKASQEQVAELRLAPAKERDFCSDLLNKKDAYCRNLEQETRRLDKVLHETRDALLSYATEAKKANARADKAENEVANWKEAYSKLSAECRRLEEVCLTHHTDKVSAERREASTSTALAGALDSRDALGKKVAELEAKLADSGHCVVGNHAGTTVTVDGKTFPSKSVSVTVTDQAEPSTRIDKIEDHVDIVEKTVAALQKPATEKWRILYSEEVIQEDDQCGYVADNPQWGSTSSVGKRAGWSPRDFQYRRKIK